MENIIHHIIILLACVAFPVFSGIAEGWYYHVRMRTVSDLEDKYMDAYRIKVGTYVYDVLLQGGDYLIRYPTNKQEKTILMWIRSAFYLVVLASPVGYGPAIGLTLLFAPLHDWTYYWMRNKLHPGTYPKPLFSFGNSAPQGMDLRPWQLWGLFFLGLLVYFWFLFQ